jgi:hypothetical protein
MAEKRCAVVLSYVYFDNSHVTEEHKKIYAMALIS